ncbi:hypothetical protein K8R03_00140 [Candidatus Kaiserbacteria bacterium]|nr:hypothetical protein [Candidatus Kaiserbacteria bacterium]
MQLILTCPFCDPVPLDRVTHVIPHHFRRYLALLQDARRELNSPSRPRPHTFNYYRSSCELQLKFDAVKNALFAYARIRAEGFIQYHNDWRFSCVTAEVARSDTDTWKRSHGFRTSAPDESAGHPQKGTGLCFAYLERPPEVFHRPEWVGHEFSGRPRTEPASSPSCDSSAQSDPP